MSTGGPGGCRSSPGNASTPSLLVAMGDDEDDMRSHAAQQAGAGGSSGAGGGGPGAGKLPRTLSTSALRIKHRAGFWNRFWEERTEHDLWVMHQGKATYWPDTYLHTIVCICNDLYIYLQSTIAVTIYHEQPYCFISVSVTFIIHSICEGFASILI